MWTLEEWALAAKVAGGAAGVFSVLGLGHLARKVPGKVRQVRSDLRATRSSIAMIPDMALQQTRIEAELHPNGGTSLRDEVRAIGRMLAMSVGSSRVIADGLGYGALEVDLSGSVTWTNAMFRRITGLEPAEALGWGWLGAVIPEDRERMREDWVGAIAERRFNRTRIVFEHVENGTRAVVLVEMHPIADARSMHVGFLALAYHREREQCETPRRRAYEQPPDVLSQ